jgi:hypothetical protein
VVLAAVRPRLVLVGRFVARPLRFPFRARQLRLRESVFSFATNGAPVKSASTFVMWRPRLDVPKPDMIPDSNMSTLCMADQPILPATSLCIDALEETSSS